MAKISDRTLLSSLAADDCFVIYDDSAGVDKKIKIATIITYILTQQLDDAQLNEAVALASTSTELDAAADFIAALTATYTEINSVCDGNTATAAEIVKAADGIGSTIPKQKIVEIGDWDMDTYTTTSVTHGMTFSKIIGVRGVIRNDANDLKFIFGNSEPGTGINDEPAITQINSTYIIMGRRSTDSFFSNANYNATSFNRGWLIVDYTD